jgi:hypothetical protein
MSPRQLQAVPPPVDSPEMWKALMNHVYGCGRDDLFAWLRDVRRSVERAARKKRRRAA